MSETPQYRHHDVVITFNVGLGRFEASLDGRRTISAPSLPAIKKKIDAARTFQPFDALRPVAHDDFRHGVDPNALWVPVRVVDAYKEKGTGNYVFTTVTEDGRRVRWTRALYEDTPENRERIKTHAIRRDIEYERHHEEEVAINALRTSITMLDPLTAVIAAGKPAPRPARLYGD